MPGLVRWDGPRLTLVRSDGLRAVFPSDRGADRPFGYRQEMADDQDNFFIELNKKLMWVHDYEDSLEGKSLMQFHATVLRVGRGQPVYVSRLSRPEAEELNELCDAVAAENNHSWRRRTPDDESAEPKRRGFWKRRKG